MTKLDCSLVKTIPVDHRNKYNQIQTIIRELKKSQKQRSQKQRSQNKERKNKERKKQRTNKKRRNSV